MLSSSFLGESSDSLAIVCAPHYYCLPLSASMSSLLHLTVHLINQQSGPLQHQRVQLAAWIYLIEPPSPLVPLLVSTRLRLQQTTATAWLEHCRKSATRRLITICFPCYMDDGQEALTRAIQRRKGRQQRRRRLTGQANGWFCISMASGSIVVGADVDVAPLYKQ